MAATRGLPGERLVMPGATDLPAELTELAAEFPGYEFATQQTWRGTSLIATRHGGCARPGLHTVVTADPDEMRRALAQQERPSRADDSRHQP